MKKFKTDQEEFWAGNFGDEYSIRNSNEKLVVSNTALFTKIIERTGPVKSIIEFGANIGLNLKALKSLLPDAEFSAVEINENAAEVMHESQYIKVYQQSIIDFKVDYKREFALIKTVLIHINPEMLPEVYDTLYNSSSRYICIAEYYNPRPVEVEYRGHSAKLFKRDFAGEMLDTYKDLHLVDYGFVYHRDGSFPQDDITWFLLEKSAGSR